MSKKLPIGIDGFEKIRTNDFYYVDKTQFKIGGASCRERVWL